MSQILSVSDCIRQLTDTFEEHFSSLWVEGEIVNLSKSPAGHWYFSLKDIKSTLSCAFFKYDVQACRDINNIKEGDKIKVWGKISIYAPRGSLQLIAKKVIKSGKGNLLEEFEKLKSRLAADGLFDLETKKKIPLLPKKVGVITAPDSAALQDFLNVYKRRSFMMDIVVFPSLVQGKLAAAQLRKALEAAIKQGMAGDLDVIVLTRGGGASEDLWCFNDEGLAWDIYNSPIPIISAIGHQIDYTIADFVADLRCETPTAAAQDLTQYQVKLTELVGTYGSRLQVVADNLLHERQSKLLSQSPQKIITTLYDKLLSQKQRLDSVSKIRDGQNILKLSDKSYKLDDIFGRMLRVQQEQLSSRQKRLQHTKELLHAYAPHNILERGFCYVNDDKKNIIKSFKQFNNLEEQGTLDVVFYDGIGKVQKVTK